MSDARSEDEVHATRFRLRIRASQVVRVATCGEKWKLKKEMDDVKVLPDGMVVVDHAGKIVEVGPASQLESKYPASDCAQDLDLTGKTIVPGFVDAVGSAMRSWGFPSSICRQLPPFLRVAVASPPLRLRAAPSHPRSLAALPVLPSRLPAASPAHAPGVVG